MRAILLLLSLLAGCAAPSRIESDPPGAAITLRDMPLGEAPVRTHFADPWGESRLDYPRVVTARWADGRESTTVVTPTAGILGDRRWPRVVRLSAPR